MTGQMDPNPALRPPHRVSYWTRTMKQVVLSCSSCSRNSIIIIHRYYCQVHCSISKSQVLRKVTTHTLSVFEVQQWGGREIFMKHVREGKERIKSGNQPRERHTHTRAEGGWSIATVSQQPRQKQESTGSSFTGLFLPHINPLFLLHCRCFPSSLSLSSRGGEEEERRERWGTVESRYCRNRVRSVRREGAGLRQGCVQGKVPQRTRLEPEGGISWKDKDGRVRKRRGKLVLVLYRRG